MTDMSQPPESSMSSPCLPAAWIERIFALMLDLYGSKFSQQWAASDPASMKRTWGEKLAGFSPAAIKYALGAMDERTFPPTLPEFLGLCRDHARRQGTAMPSLPAPELTREEAAARIGRLTSAAPQKQGLDPRGWCKSLKRDYLAGKKLNQIQIDMASEALGETWRNGQCGPKLAA